VASFRPAPRPRGPSMLPLALAIWRAIGACENCEMWRLKKSDASHSPSGRPTISSNSRSDRAYTVTTGNPRRGGPGSVQAAVPHQARR